MTPSARYVSPAATKPGPATSHACRARYQHPGISLISAAGNPAAIYSAWEDGLFTLLCSTEQLDELRTTLQKPRVAALIKPYTAGRLVNQLKRLAEDVGPLPPLKRSPDPFDDFLLAMSEAGNADFLVTGDKGGLLTLRRHKSTRIIAAHDFVTHVL